MRAALAGLLLLGCTGGNTVRVAGVTVALVTPASEDPLAGADALVVRVLDLSGRELERVEGPPEGGLSIPPLTTFGRVEIEVTARAGDTVLAAARTGPVAVGPGDERTLDALFLPVNRAIRLDWTPRADRIGHLALHAPDGRILLLGGRVPSAATPRGDSEWWDRRLGYDGDGPDLPAPVTEAAWARLDGATVLVAGGTGSGGATDRVLAVDLGGPAVRPAGTLVQADPDPCVVAHPSLGALIFRDGATEVWTALGRVGVDTGFDGEGVATCAETGGRVVVAGAADGGWGVLDLAEATWPVDLAERFTSLDDVPSLVGPMTVALDDGRVWVAGGFGFTPVATTRLIEPSTARSTRGPDLERPRVYGRAAPWRDRTLVVTGGFVDEIRSDAVEWLEIHHPDDGPLLSVPVPVRGASTTVLPGGAVLYTGGLDAERSPAGAWAVVPWLPETP
jgi:hypothetical protein